MNEVEFQALAAQGYNRIPLLAEAFADLDTPLSLYLKLTQGGFEEATAAAASQSHERVARPGTSASAGSFLLESVVGGERFGRYSFIGLPARTWIRTVADSASASGVRTEVVTDGQIVQSDLGDPLEFVRTIACARITMPTAMVRLSAGRQEMSEGIQALCFFAGANSIFYGDKLLTTGNPEAKRDRVLLDKLGMHPAARQG